MIYDSQLILVLYKKLPACRTIKRTHIIHMTGPVGFMAYVDLWGYNLIVIPSGDLCGLIGKPWVI